MRTLADLFRSPDTVHFRGHDYKLRKPDQVEEGLFSRYLEQRAKEFVRRSVDLTPEERDRHLVAVAAFAAAGGFEWGSPAYVEGTANPFTAAHLILIVLRAENPERRELAAPDADQFVRGMVAQCLAEIVAINAAEIEADPLKKKAILEAVGLPPTYLDSSAGSSPG